MTVRALPYLLAFVLGAGAAGLTACGAKTNEAMLPAQNADELLNHLDDVLVATEGEDCAETGRAIRQVELDLESLPSGTSQRLEDRLREGVARLKQQAADECQGTTETQTTQTETTHTETTPTITTTTTTTTETVPTVPPTTTTTTTTPTTTTPPVATVPPEGTGGAGAP